MYTATITSASLRLRESRIVAGLLLQGLSRADWKAAVQGQNVLQMGSVESVRRISNLIRARLEPLGEGLWEMVRDGDRPLATQAVFAGAVKNSRLLGDFMDLTLRDQRAAFAEKLEISMWNAYLEGCRGRDPGMPHWSEATRNRLRSAVFSMLAEAGYLNSPRNLRLQNVFVDDQLSAYLQARSETYVLRCLKVSE